ncbi:FolC protein [Helicobacter sp. MIT 14-3879]|nr:FolC protein [Helicobacter sp. MIT 14-3879]
MESKAQEYTIFEPSRSQRIFAKLKPYLCLKSFNIHIIGTNGKGSTGRFIAQSLFESGFRVLHFTSPHLFDFRERFYLNDSIISHQDLESAHIFLQQLDFIGEASYFEYATFLACVLAKKCEFLVMEAGVGGEYDSTSVLDYHVTIFTRIGIDHKDLLGNDLQAIATTKLLAAQGEIFTHFQEDDVLEMLANLTATTRKIGSIHYLTKKDISAQEVRNLSQQYNFPYFLQENLALANLVLCYINQHIAKANLTQSRLNLRGRFEILNHHIMLDVGHNEMAAKAVLQEIKNHIGREKFILVYNSYKGKEVAKILNIFKNSIEKIILFEVAHPRILEKQTMIKIIEKLSIPYSFFSLNQQNLDYLSKNSIQSRISFLESTKKYLVFGSFSLIESFLLWYNSLRTSINETP